MLLPYCNQRQWLKIGELARALETTPRTLRLYESLGVITPSRTEGGTRLYAAKDVKRMAVALRLARAGLNLDDVERLARTREGCNTGAESAATVLDLLEEMRKKISAAMEDLTLLQRDLERADMLIRQCLDCPNRPNRKDCPHCPVDKNVDLTDIARLVWDPDCP